LFIQIVEGRLKMTHLVKNILIVEGRAEEKSRLLTHIAANGIVGINYEVIRDPAWSRYSDDLRIEFNSNGTAILTAESLAQLFPKLCISYYYIVNVNNRAGCMVFDEGRQYADSESLWEDWRTKKPNNLIHSLNMRFDKSRYIKVLKLFLEDTDKSKDYDKGRIETYQHYLKLAEAHSNPVTMPVAGYQSDIERFICI
jgi:hypothetical protein